MHRSQRRAKRLTSSLKWFRIPVWVYGAGLVGLLLVILIAWISSWSIRVLHDYINLQSSSTATVKDKFDASLEIAKTIAGGIGTIATIGGGAFVFWNIQLTQSRLITERFSKAVEQLASDKIEVRLGGIYALERIAYDSSRDHWTIMEVLTSFVQEKSPVKRLSDDEIRAKAYEIWKKNDRGSADGNWRAARRELSYAPVPKDIQAALTVIVRRKHENDPLGKRIDLSSANLSGANFRFANLRFANLYGADLSDANLRFADLRFADLRFANLSNAILYKADLSDANLNFADLRFANLSNADLRDADLSFANLNDANLSFANLRDAGLINAHLRGAKLWSANLSNADLRDANLRDASLRGTDLRGVILINIDLSVCKGLDQSSFEGEDPPKLCNVILPNGITVDPNRDCDWLRSEGYDVPDPQ